MEAAHLRTARQEGREAACAGKQATDCPYQIGTQSRYQWMFGFSSTNLAPPSAIGATDGEIIALAEHHGLVWSGRGMAHSEAGVGQDIKAEILAFARDLLAGRASA